MAHSDSLRPAEEPFFDSLISLKEATVALGLLTPEEFDQKVRPERKSAARNSASGQP